MKKNAEKMYVYISRSLAEGREPERDGYFRFRKQELERWAMVPPSSISKKIDEVIAYLYHEHIGWVTNSDFTDMILSDGIFFSILIILQGSYSKYHQFNTRIWVKR